MALIKSSHLPEMMVGSEKQINWAKSIRLEYLAACVGPMALLERGASPERFAQVTEAHAKAVCSHTDAKWWIDHRDTLGDDINEEMAVLLSKKG